MENRKNENNMNLAGDISREMEEIQKMQTVMPQYLTVVTNTCSGFRTIFCC
ncbi:hypothetical protein [Frisingicoccus sp.]|uniref:hypothetical protein n=1 Tax=Frisingicoccus sp. TaxID=1918627 RepID=UPI003AB16499